MDKYREAYSSKARTADQVRSMMTKFFKILNKFSARQSFDDGSNLFVLHRYALRYAMDGHTLDIGFEQALEPGIDRLIHVNTITHWSAPNEQVMLTDDEKRDVVEKIQEYCNVRALSYRLVSG